MQHKAQKSGLSVLECVVALSVLAAMLTTVLSIQVLQSTRIGLAKHRLAAEQTLNNLAQRILAAESGASVSPDVVQQWATSMEQAQNLPPKTLQIAINQVDEPVAGQRFELSWVPASKKLPSYSLVTWRFSGEEPATADTPAEEAQP
ncbi:hypothetical protein [Bremerella cremea]|uniref:hypothetical protein n=1 Tax=Bremerella cremea TaxID=1031537 RepID=UPI0031EBBEBC